MTQEKDLSLVSTAELFDEIRRRNDSTALITLKRLDEYSDSSSFFYTGGKHTVLGLLTRYADRILKELQSSEEEIED